MTTPGFQQPQPAQREADLREPMPWMSRGRTGGSLALPGVKRPLGALIYGLVLLALGVAALLTAADVGAAVTGWLLFAVAAGLGVWLIVIAAIRLPWYRKYIQVHGHPPF
ncbi:hypothetical protein AL755_20560 [Arthrobacter sp. ERGS1:01]|uniref:hypothetical protein n=1 Tax=Arthrobacter sp. ERGS1:01 TaxID=1704044 RepID=UPI0006B56E32|nr:hypothetical protein [Arthrobacter sp. ERGS1:01]ALE07320.1 hypothetical protein AL755_20560 [Arthrobacter sp. ERGS1:01]